ncbi:MAG: basic amino acid ABC transporter substrate-binding protein [Clostridium sp.]|nr:basic amino acid ABC transporter substrate-binding protein [Clostridium sp.]
MKKQFAALSMAAMMAAVSLAGCSSKPAETAAPATEAATEAASEAAETEAEETEAAAESKGTLVMATNAEFPPYEFHDGGEIVGIDVEIAAAIAKELGMDFEVEDIAFDSIIPEVQSGKADFGAAGITVTEDRKQSVDFSDTYATATQVIIVKEDNTEIETPDDLVGKTIGVQLGTTGDIYASDIEDATIEQYNKGFEAVQALSQNKIDAVIIDGEPAKVFVSENEGLKILDEAFTTEEYAICVKKGNTELLEDINTAIANLKESGELQEIVDKYITAE